jgi:hypothetical protein
MLSAGVMQADVPAKRSYFSFTRGDFGRNDLEVFEVAADRIEGHRSNAINARRFTAVVERMQCLGPTYLWIEQR